MVWRPEVWEQGAGGWFLLSAPGLVDGHLPSGRVCVRVSSGKDTSHSGGGPPQ